MIRFVATALALLATVGAARNAQALELDDCRISAGPGQPALAARCGVFVRPLNPDDDTAGTIELKVAVVPALSLEPLSDPLVPVAGGPGQSTLKFYAGWFRAFERVRQQRDILLVDQRGTGDSVPLTCEIDEGTLEGKYSAEQTVRVTEECLAQLPADPRFFTTSIAVQDLAALREELGYGPLNLYGVSYGSRVAQHFARRFPAATRTLIIDGVVPPQLPLGPNIAIESQRALDRVFTRCAEDPACAERFPELRADFDALRSSLEGESVLVELPHPLTAEPETLEFGTAQFGVAIRLLLYNAHTVALLPLLIEEAAEGNFAPLVAQFQMAATALSAALSIGMHNAVMCTEDVPFIDWERVDYAALESSYLGTLQLDAIRAICSVWPRGALDADLREPLSGDIPALLLSGEADPITSPEFAALASVNLERAWLLTGRNQGHGLAVIGCMPRLIDHFIDTMSLDNSGSECLEDAFAMPFFIDFTGPLP